MPTSANTIAQANRLLSDSTAANSGAARANASVVATPVIEILAIGCDGNDCCEVANDPARAEATDHQTRGPRSGGRGGPCEFRGVRLHELAHARRRLAR